MDILNIQKTEAELAKDRIVEINSISSNALTEFISSFEIAYSKFWTDENPQALCDVLGNNAYKLFQASGATLNYIMTLRPDYTPPVVARGFTINEDGTVTIDNETSPE